MELGVYAHRGLRWLCSWPWAVPMTAWKQEMLQSGFPLFSSVRAHICLLHDLLMRGALWDTVVSHLSQRFSGSHDGTPHPMKGHCDVWTLRTMLGLKHSLLELRWSWKNRPEMVTSVLMPGTDYLLQTQSFRNGLVRFVSDTPALRHKPQLKHHHR